MVKRAAVGRPAGVGTAAVALAAIFAVSVGALVVLRWWPDAGAGLRVKRQPITYRVESAATTTTMPTTVTVRLTAPQPALAPTWTGLVTAVLAKEGQVINQGAPVLEVDGHVIKAMHTDKPLYRPLTLGDSGADVDGLRSVLRTLHYAVSTDGSVDAEVADAVADWLGRRPARAGPVLSPTDVLWLPQAGLVATSVAATVGAPAPGPGTPVLTFAPVAAGASVSGYPQAGPIRRSTVEIAGHRYDVQDGQVSVNGQQRSELGQVAAQAAGTTDGTSNGVSGSASNGAAPAGAASGQPSATTGGQTPGATVQTLNATLSITWTSNVATVPTASLITRTNGTLCVVTGKAAMWAARTVTVVSSSTATGLSDALGIGSGATVVVNPHDAGLDAICTV